MKTSLPPQAAPRSTPETRARNTSERPLKVPFTIIVDSNEGAPYGFRGLRANSTRSYRPLAITTFRDSLETGDYSIVGFSEPGPSNNHRAITIERKSLSDIFSSLSRNTKNLGPKEKTSRTKLREEHERMYGKFHLNGGQAHVVIEGRYDELDEFYEANNQRGVAPEDLRSTHVRWFDRYHVPWHFAGSRSEAEKLTFRLLECFYELHKHELQPEALKESNT